MSLFNSETKNIPDCACNSNCASSEITQTINDCDCRNETKKESCSIKVLGSGCSSCHAQYENVKQAIKKMGLSAETEYVTDFKKIAEYGIMSVPAIVVNEKVVSAGKVLKADNVEKLLHKCGY